MEGKELTRSLMKITDHYGLNHQLKKLQEEIWELNEAILTDMSLKRITEELADCFVLLTQVQVYYGIYSDDIDKVYNYKIRRQLSRIAEEENNEIRH